MKRCIWCNDPFDDEDARSNAFDPYCSSLCAARAHYDNEQDNAEDNDDWIHDVDIFETEDE